MELAPVAFLTLLVAIAGPVGITLGWWLGKRSERERTAREERKSAYVAFTTAAIQYRNSNDEERRQRRNERWEAFAVLTLVAPPAMVEIAAHMAAAGDKLLARSDLHIDETDAFAALTPVIDDRLTFENRLVPDPTAPPDDGSSGLTE